MLLFKYLLVSFILSALGSIPVGLITLTIAQKTLEKGSNSGWQIALGATIPEFVYTYIALVGIRFFEQNQSVTTNIKIASIFIFFALGAYYFFKKNKEIGKTQPNMNKDFIHGILTGTANFLIIPFWLFIGIWLESNGFFFEDQGCIIAFSLGSAIGALLIFYFYIILAESILKKSKIITTYANKAIGVLFLGLAIFQTFQIFS